MVLGGCWHRWLRTCLYISLESEVPESQKSLQARSTLHKYETLIGEAGMGTHGCLHFKVVFTYESPYRDFCKMSDIEIVSFGRLKLLWLFLLLILYSLHQ